MSILRRSSQQITKFLKQQMRRNKNKDMKKRQVNNNPLNNNSNQNLSKGGGRGTKVANTRKITKISKKMSYVLRHGAEKEGFTMDDAGFITIKDFLGHKMFAHLDFETIKEVVEKNNKKRFELVEDPEGSDTWKIRAVQGHSITTIKEDAIYEEITDPNEFPMCVHGTDRKAWTNFIRFQGLKKMARTHIHFARGLPGDDGVISGMRYSTEVVIQIDMEKAIGDGYRFFKAKNDVILCAGKSPEGCVPPAYFKKVMFKKGSKPCTFVEIDPKTFDYLLVLDFEANCLENEKLDCQEIIEFPVVPLKTSDLSLAAEPFHQYVKPEVHPEISAFCTKLTGIDQDMVSDGTYTLDVVLRDLDSWMAKNGFNEQNSTVVTCGRWDLNTCLRSEASFKGLKVPKYLKKFINVKDIWMQVLFKKKAAGMPGMLSSLGLELDGRHHSGIDDSKNIAKIVKELLNRGGQFTQFQEIIVKEKKVKPTAAQLLYQEKKQKEALLGGVGDAGDGSVDYDEGMQDEG